MSLATVGSTRPIGELSLVKSSRAIPGRELTLKEIHEYGFPHQGLLPEVYQYRRRNLTHLFRGLKKVAAARLLNLANFYGQLSLVVFREDGTVVPLGLVSLRVVTTAGVNFIATRFVDAATSIGAFDFHAFGTGGTAEAVGDTTLVTELTTQYVGDVRPTGTPSNPTANVYQSVGTLSPDSGGTIAVTEHGLTSANAAGTLLDRSLFSVVNVVANADSLQATYSLTISSGG
jgi:hypothetical protein